jgi:predicted nucleotidyltransferase
LDDPIRELQERSEFSRSAKEGRMAGANVQRSIEEMVRRIVASFDPDRIVLFGSHARGSAGADSDVDLLIVMPVSGSKRKLAIEIERKLLGCGVSKDVIVVTPEEVERYRDVVGTIIYPALREGTVLYERAERGESEAAARVRYGGPLGDQSPLKSTSFAVTRPIPQSTRAK